MPFTFLGLSPRPKYTLVDSKFLTLRISGILFMTIHSKAVDVNGLTFAYLSIGTSVYRLVDLGFVSRFFKAVVVPWFLIYQADLTYFGAKTI
jgi:hypothetical protein